MNRKTVEKIINESDKMLDALSDEQLTVWNFFVNVNNIVSKHAGIDCLMNLNFANGGITQGLCVITDWKPGALAFQSDEGELPRMRVVFPEDYKDFMEQVMPIFDVQYPEFPSDQEE